MTKCSTPETNRIVFTDFSHLRKQFLSVPLTSDNLAMINRLLPDSLTTITGRNLLILFLLTSGIYIGMLLITIPTLNVFSGGKDILDMMPGGYDIVYVNGLFDSLSEEGRAYYLTRQIPLDLIYPALFAITYSALFVFVLRRMKQQTHGAAGFALLPLIAGTADYIENAFIVALLTAYPDISETQVTVASIFSVIKASATSLYFVALIVLLGIYGIHTLRQRSNAVQS